MKLQDITVEVRDKELNRVGLIRPEILKLEIAPQFNNVGTWKLELPAEHPLVPVLRTPGSGLIVTGPNDVLLSGPTVRPEFAASPGDRQGTVVFEGVDDNVILSDALAFPQPGNPNPTTQTLAHDTRTGFAEALMHQYVNANIGPGAPAARRGGLAQKLIMGTNLNRGGAAAKSARFPVLGVLLGEIAVAAGLGFRVVQRGDNLVFETYAIVDRTSEIRLDVRNGTLAGQRVAVSPPGLTRAIVAGQGDLVDRTFKQVDNAESIAAEADWGRRIERFIDQRQTDDDAELIQAGTEALAEEGFTAVAIQAVPVESQSSRMRFGIDWFIGDKVTVVVGGQELTSVATAMVLRADEQGFRIGAMIGDAAGFDPGAAMAKQVQDTVRRINSLEANAEAAGSLPAVAVTVSPGGIILSTDVQGALEDLRDRDTIQVPGNGTLNLNPTGGLVATGAGGLLTAGNLYGAQTLSGSQAGANTVLNGNQIYARNGATANGDLFLNHASSGYVYLGQSGTVRVAPGSQIESTSGYLHLNWSNGLPVAIGSSATTMGRLGGALWRVDGRLEVNGTDPTITTPNIHTSAGTALIITTGGVFRRSSSSAKYKTNIAPLEMDPEQLIRLEPKLYQRKDHERRVPVPSLDEETEWIHIPDAEVTEDTPWSPGFIAEEAQALGLTPWLQFWNDELDGFDYAGWTAAQQVILRQHHARIEELEDKNATLEARLARLEQALGLDSD